MDPRDLHAFAVSEVAAPNPAVPEASYRRAVSASYYALFHALAAEGARAFAAAGPAVVARAARTFSHGEMKKVCGQFRSWKPDTENALLRAAAPDRPDMRLAAVADAFIKLQEGREIADYDLAATISQQDASEAVQRASRAMREFDEVRHEPATRAFLAVLLLGDRLKLRRG